MDAKKLLDMSDDDLRALAKKNSGAWHTAGEGDKAGLHAENVRINKILDSRRGESTAFDPTSGTWAARGEDKGGTLAAPGPTGQGGMGAMRAIPAVPFTYKTAPEYVSKNQAIIDAALEKLRSRPAFSYDPETDPAYQQYREQYTRSGERAMEDTLGQVSARTGGLASSYAGSAAQQSYNQYMAALNDKIPELRQLAYEMYRAEGDEMRAELNTLLSLEQMDQGLYQSRLGQYNADRSFAYGEWSDRQDREYKAGRDAMEDRRLAEETEYQRGRDARQDAIDDRERAVSEAVDIYNATGDAARLAEQWGLSPEQAQGMVEDYARQKGITQREAAIQIAKEQAAMGDLSGYRELGWDTGYAQKMQDYELRQAAAELVKKQSGGSASGGGGTGKPRLSAAQVWKSLNEDGIVNQETLDAYRYWYGEDWQAPGADGADDVSPAGEAGRPGLDWENRDLYGARPQTVTMDLTGHAAKLLNDYIDGEMSAEELADRIQEDSDNGKLKKNEVNEILRRLGV